MHNQRARAFVVSIVLSMVTIFIMPKVLPATAAMILFDWGRSTWPITVQNVMWLAFFLGWGEMWVRWMATRREELQLRRGYLPEDEATVLKPGVDITPLYQKVIGSRYRHVCFLPRMIERCLLHFNISHSVDQTNSILQSSLDLFLHEIELRYTLLKYLIWLIPSLGFIGTVVGIMMALNFAGDPANVQNEGMLFEVTGLLGVAFSTTLVALVMAAFLVLGQSLVQSMEERNLNKSGQYCLDNLINRLYTE